MNHPINKIINDAWPTFTVNQFRTESPPWLYEQLDNEYVKCGVCKRRCVIPPGGTGFCLARENEGGKVVNKKFGSLNALYPDPFWCGDETDVLSVDGFNCNFRCRFCFATTWMTDKKELPPIIGFQFPFNSAYERNRNESENKRIIVEPRTIVEICKTRGLKYIVLGRSEPSVNVEFTMQLASAALAEGIGTIVYTNGYSTEPVNKDYAKLMSDIVVGVKCYFDQAGYDKVCGAGIDVNGIFETILDLHKYGGKYRIDLLADGMHGDPREAYRMIGKLKEYLTPEEVKELDISIIPVVCFSNKPGSKVEDKLINARPGDIIGAVELEMGLKRLGFHNAHTQYSIDYKAIYGEYPSFWCEEAKNGWLAEVEKKEFKNDIKSYVYLGSPVRREPPGPAPITAIVKQSS